jgi:cytoskeletal protein CcmA (bactofilin family)
MRNRRGAIGDWKSIRLTGSAGRDGDAFSATGVERAAGNENTATGAPPTLSGTFIESGAIFEGRLLLQGDFRIDSEFRGELKTDGIIVIGPDGSVIGDIRARGVEIHGAVLGDVVGRRQVLLRAGARLHGNIETACLEIEKHAFFQGGTTMTQPQVAHSRTDEPRGKAANAPATPPVPDQA